MNFDDAFTKLVDPQHEGGYVNDPHDPGGETKYGVSKRQYPMENIAALTLERAKTIYARDYWGPAGCDSVPDAMKFDLFDAAVNGGVSTAIKLLQRAAGIADDGVLGSHTLLALQTLNPWQLQARFDGWRLDHLNDNPDQWTRYGRGWSQRIAENLKAA